MVYEANQGRCRELIIDGASQVTKVILVFFQLNITVISLQNFSLLTCLQGTNGVPGIIQENNLILRHVGDLHGIRQDPV